MYCIIFFFSSRRRHTRYWRDWSSDVCSSDLFWLDTLTAIIVPTAASAFGVFFLRQFFIGLPVELEEAARVDGAKPWQTFFRVVLPLSKPALSTLLLLSFLTNWNDFLWPLYVLFSPERLTLPPGLAILQGAYTINYPVIMAGGVGAGGPWVKGEEGVGEEGWT